MVHNDKGLFCDVTDIARVSIVMYHLLVPLARFVKSGQKHPCRCKHRVSHRIVDCVHYAVKVLICRVTFQDPLLAVKERVDWGVLIIIIEFTVCLHNVLHPSHDWVVLRSLPILCRDNLLEFKLVKEVPIPFNRLRVVRGLCIVSWLNVLVCQDLSGFNILAVLQD